MEAVDLSRFYSGGYFLIRAGNPGWEQLKTDLLPAKLLSLSTCICPRVQLSWGWRPGDRDAALKFGIPKTKLDEFVEWCSYAHQTDIDVWSMFYTADAARRFIKRFLDDTDDLYLIGAGLSHELEQSNWREPIDAEKKGVGVEKRIEQRIPVESGGQPLGFEVVSFSYSDFGHSWLCNGIQFEMHKQFGIRPGAFGLIQAESEARRVYEWIETDHLWGEPEPYDYWLLVSYPLDLAK